MRIVSVNVGLPRELDWQGRRVRTGIFTDCVEQLRGTAGKRQVNVRCETAVAGSVLPASNGFVAFSKHPS